jgi:FSR family fosmidomycin resistance protein-like MFS transporter
MPPVDDEAVNRRGVALMSSAHVVDDIYQGVVPALLPFMVADRGYSYAAVAGLTLAATVLSSVAQPVFGWWTDRHPRPWMVAAGITTAATGIALAGLFDGYIATWLVIALSGLGIAAFHPEAARNARKAAGNSNRGMSVFALGGNAGYALGALITTPVLLWLGLHGTVLLAVPAVVVVVVLISRMSTIMDGPAAQRSAVPLPSGPDDWPAFLRLTAVVIVRSMLFFGVTSFVALYFIEHFDTSKAVGGAALTTFLIAGAAGTLLGGWIGDRFSRLTSMRLGFLLAVPALAGMVLAGGERLAFVFVALAGIAVYLPFSVMVMLGQDYLPNRIGTASGVTVGLAVSIGGLFSPVVGWIADSFGLRTALAVLIILPAVALVMSTFLREPQRGQGEVVAAVGQTVEC